MHIELVIFSAVLSCLQERLPSWNIQRAKEDNTPNALLPISGVKGNFEDSEHHAVEEIERELASLGMFQLLVV